MISDFIKALEHATPKGVGWQIGEEKTFDSIIWDNPEEAITEDEFNLALDYIRSISYRDQRKNEYPSIGDQLDALFHAGLFPEEMADRIREVKEKYPKEI
jgi:hypothetical protein